MRQIHLVLTAVSALLVGTAAGFFFGAQSATPPARAPEVAGNVPDNGPPTESNPQPAEPPAQVPAATPAQIETPAPVTAPTGTLAAWLATLGDVRPEPGTGRITGRITTSDGTAVVGAEVVATAHYPQPATPPVNPSVEEMIENNARQALFRSNGRFTALTDANGDYAIGGLGSYHFHVRPSLLGWRFVTADRSSGTVRPDAELDFTASAVCELDLDIRLPDGTQPQGANVSLVKERGRSSGSGWRPDSTRSEIEPGQSTLTVTAGQYRQFVSEPMKLDVEPNRPLKLTVQLRAVPGLVCLLNIPKTLQRAEVRNLSVALQLDPPAESPTEVPRTGLVNGRSEYDSSGDSNGSSFTQLAPGRYRAMAIADHRVLAWKDVVIGNDFLEVELVVPEPKVTDYIVARVLRPDGKPDHDTRLHITFRGKSFTSDTDVTIVKKSDGSHWILRSTPERAREDDDWVYEITVVSSAYGVKTVSYPRDATHELLIQLEEPSSLTVTVPGISTHAHRTRLRPQLTRATGNNRWNSVGSGSSHRHPDSARGLPSQGDEISYTVLTQGRYRFSIQYSVPRDNHFTDNVTLAEIEFDVVAGQNTQTLAVPPIYTLTVVVAEPARVQYFEVRREDGLQRRSIFGENIAQRTVIEGLTPGAWILRTRDGQMRVQVNGDTEVALTLRKFDCLILAGIKPGGKIEGMGLQNGDKVIKVDNQEWDDIELFMLQIRTSATKEATTWTLIRAGAQAEVQINGKELFRLANERESGAESETFYPTPGMRD